MNLPKLSLSWSTADLIKALIECLRQIETADGENLKRNADIEVAGASFILTSAGGVRVKVTTDDLGNLTGTPL
jgi:hypothetical protein